ncbi:acetamidase/formamidase family protein [Metabacillus idriensis]|uniref:acetamidase/formamidase family protein n=1 Tax=Metabacillus idriensis TaxID=324768 RepID=UPI002966FAD4|nr:acetamidase/formamidase family protein [Metabacillus idriensis]
MSDKEIVFDINEMIVKETKKIEKKGAVEFPLQAPAFRGRDGSLYFPQESSAFRYNPLKVLVDGALFSIGDGHAVQGDGEVSGTAIECPMDFVDVTLIVKGDMQINMPRANTPSGWVTFGFHEDLNEATAQ